MQGQSNTLLSSARQAIPYYLKKMQSLSFLQNIKLKAEKGIQLSLALLALFLFVLFVIESDGFSVITSIACFAFPLSNCLSAFGERGRMEEAKLKQSFLKKGATGEAQWLTRKKTKLVEVQAYMVYFIFCIISEVLTPIVRLVASPLFYFFWNLLRLASILFMLNFSKRKGFAYYLVRKTKERKW